jgi:hypothetical protein
MTQLDFHTLKTALLTLFVSRAGLYAMLLLQLLETLAPWIGRFQAVPAPVHPDVPATPTQIANLVAPTTTAPSSANSITLIRRFTSSTSTADSKRSTENPNIERVDAVLDYISNLDAAKHVRIDTRCTVSNDADIALTPQITARVKETATNDTDATVHITLTSQTLRVSELRNWIDEIHTQYVFEKTNRLGTRMYYFNEIPVEPPKILDPNTKQETYRLEQAPKHLVFTMNEFHTAKSFTNVYGDHVAELRDRLDLFVHHPEWYAARGIPHSLGILLHGIPGAGKTSTIKAIARDTNRHIFNLSLRSFTTQKQLTSLFYNETVTVTGADGQPQTYRIPLNRRLYVIEDIDCLSDVVLDRQAFPRPEPASGDLLTLSFLLNLLDGVLETPGRILVITTNYPERLDPALIRPGRIDVRIDFGKAVRAMILEMVNHFYDVLLTADDIPAALDGVLTPAEVMECLCAHFRDPEGAIAHLVQKANQPRDRDRIETMLRAGGSTALEQIAAVEMVDINTTESEHSEAQEITMVFDHIEAMSPMELTVTDISAELHESGIPPAELLQELEQAENDDDIAELIKARANDIAQIEQYRDAQPSLEALQREVESAENQTELLRGYINRLDELHEMAAEYDGLAPY